MEVDRSTSLVPARSELERTFDDKVYTTRLDKLVGWCRKFSLWQYPFVTACCGMEFMAASGNNYDTDRFGAAFPRFSPRQADMLMIVGTINHKQAPVLKAIYDQMCEPRWVVAVGACATSGGFYKNYAAVAGADKVQFTVADPVRHQDVTQD